jgi:hypothetical protein
VAASAIVLAGCGGGSSSTSTAAYVKIRCTALSAWKSAVQHAGTELQAAAPKTLVAGKRAYATFVGKLVTATRRAGAALRSAGTPSVSNGKRIATALTDAFAGAQSSFARAAGTARQIPLTSTSAYAKAVTAVNASIRQTLSAMESISSGNSPQLQAAAAKEPACKSLTSS